ncbi:MAG: hypothetical protein H7122_02240 [Chitinophagaceae bacterium]|nr:hypothetical protein [Chitinophagaceae bacterium]
MPARIVSMKRMPVLIAVLLLVLSCQKELSDEVTQTSLTIISDFHEKNRNDVQAFSVNPATAITITTNKGAKIYLPVNGFSTQDGRPVTGNVTVTVKEIYTPGEMILSNMPTIAGGRLLESAGEFEIKASQNKDPLKLSAGSFIKIDIPSKGVDMQGMQVFNGVADADGNVDWAVNTNPGNVVVRDSLLFSGSTLFADDINWLNCDKFINDPTVDFTAYPGNAPGDDSTNVFVHLTGRNTVVKMNWTRGLNYFRTDKLLAVPSTIVGISARNGRLFASVTTATIAQGSSITMNFLPYTEQQLKDRLSQLR